MSSILQFLALKELNVPLFDDERYVDHQKTQIYRPTTSFYVNY